MMKHKLLVILGPTSTGKTDLALYIAKKFNGEVISADSRQVYKYLDIGTGKLPSEFTDLKKENNFWEIDGIKIWMYDVVVDPKLRFNLYQYIVDVQKVINDIASRGKLPILTGGTGLYIRSLLEGVSDFGISEDIKLREELGTKNIEEIRKRIKLLNPEILENLNNSELNNKRRLIRILEKLIVPQKENESFLGIENNFNILKIGLKTEKQILDSRIKQRVQSRINQGMITESENLLANKTLTFERMDQLGLEYRYLAKLIKGEIKNIDEFIEILSLKIIQFAKRQMTWFKKEKDVNWFDISNSDFSEKVVNKIQDWYNKRSLISRKLKNKYS